MLDDTSCNLIKDIFKLAWQMDWQMDNTNSRVALGLKIIFKGKYYANWTEKKEKIPSTHHISSTAIIDQIDVDVGSGRKLRL